MPIVSMLVQCPYCGREFTATIETPERKAFNPNDVIFKSIPSNFIVQCENPQCKQMFVAIPPTNPEPPAAH